MMIKRTLETKKEELEKVMALGKELEKRAAEITIAIDEAQTEDEQKIVEENIDKYESEKDQQEKEKLELMKEIDRLEKELEMLESKQSTVGDQIGSNGVTDNTTKIIDNGRAVNRLNGIEIRNLPMGKKAFDALPMEQRKAIVAQNDVQSFFAELRSAAKNQRAISGGDLIIPVVFLDLIAENMYRYSKLINRVRVRNVTGQARQTIAGTVPEAVWTEMCGAINELTFVFNQITLDGYKVAGFVPVCNSLLESNDIDLASWLVEMISESLGLAKDKAILYGKGAAYKMPLGIVTRLAQTGAPADYPASAPAWVDLHTSNLITIDDELTGAAFWSALTVAASNTFTTYARGEKFWAMNSRTLALLQSKVITFTATGDIAAGIYGTLPIINGNIDVLEFIPDGDIIGGYGDLYLWAQRGGTAIEMSREAQFIQDNTVFRGKEVADGQPIVASAFVGINILGNSVTTAMSFAADNANNVLVTGLTIGSETLSPSFDSGVYTYNVTASAASDAVNVTSAVASANIAISYNGKNIKNGGTVTWTADGTAHPLTVTVTNGNATAVYTVNVTKAA